MRVVLLLVLSWLAVFAACISPTRRIETGTPYGYAVIARDLSHGASTATGTPKATEPPLLTAPVIDVRVPAEPTATLVVREEETLNEALDPTLADSAVWTNVTAQPEPGTGEDLAATAFLDSAPREAGDTEASDVTLSLTGVPLAAPRDPNARQMPEEGEIFAPFGVGFTVSPGTFLLGWSLDYRVDERLTAGATLQVGLENERTLVAPFVQGRYWFEMEEAQPQLQPFVQAGLGAVWIDKHFLQEWGFLLNVGGGVRILTGENYYIGSTALLNFIPGKAAGESFYFSWEVVQVVLRL